MLDALMAAEDSWQLRLLEALPAGVAYAREGRLVFVNDTLATLLRTSKEQLIGIDGFSLVAPEEREFVRARYLARVRGEEPPEYYAVTLCCGDGVRRRMELMPRMLGANEVILTLRDLDGAEKERRL